MGILKHVLLDLSGQEQNLLFGYIAITMKNLAIFVQEKTKFGEGKALGVCFQASRAAQSPLSRAW